MKRILIIITLLASTMAFGQKYTRIPGNPLISGYSYFQDDIHLYDSIHYYGPRRLGIYDTVIGIVDGDFVAMLATDIKGIWTGGDGDTDTSGVVNATDAQKIANYIRNTIAWDDNLMRGDMNADGVISLFDANFILWRAAGYSLDSVLTTSRRAYGAAFVPTYKPGQVYVPLGMWVGAQSSTIPNPVIIDSIPSSSGRNVLLVNSTGSDFTKCLALKLDGKLGIGTDTPAQALDVNGNIKFKSYLYPSFFEEDTEPDIPNNTVGFWIDTDDTKTYIIIDYGGTQKKIELL